ncbi:hypothetical protein K435DRAFT_938465 [Dendrothele bispora CBS 962.96]|uniref:Uncharacterized protein n=1 Tax=Dendrothele bispora (strain CBS 962.96) TaxID=1314807 RepID=A0A4S8KYC8_DENBC|nr:hypothetical protein K435DRAFT_938465 [Dendrothele bispora CBS 962.96]
MPARKTYSLVIQFSLPLMFCTLLYGPEPCAYLVLFMACTYIITHRKGCVKKMQLIALVTFCIGTFLRIKEEIFYDFPRTFEKYPLWSISRMIVLFGLYVSANIFGVIPEPSITADVVLIHRCYKIWGAKKKIIVFPVFISIINNGLALVELITMVIEIVKGSTVANFMGKSTATSIGTSMFRLMGIGEATLKSFFKAVNFFTNSLIPLMIAGRIWWIGHQVSKLLPKNKFHPKRHAMAVCLESGIMYPLALIPALVLDFKFFGLNTEVMDEFSLIPILTQVVGIAPTFIIYLMDIITYHCSKRISFGIIVAKR